MSAKTKVTKTKTALKQETYNLSDLKHDLDCGGFVELGGPGLGLGLIMIIVVTYTVAPAPSTRTPKLSKFITIMMALSLSSSLLN
jgi:hypothetical protein